MSPALTPSRHPSLTPKGLWLRVTVKEGRLWRENTSAHQGQPGSCLGSPARCQSPFHFLHLREARAPIPESGNPGLWPQGGPSCQLFRGLGPHDKAPRDSKTPPLSGPASHRLFLSSHICLCPPQAPGTCCCLCLECTAPPPVFPPSSPPGGVLLVLQVSAWMSPQGALPTPQARSPLCLIPSTHLEGPPPDVMICVLVCLPYRPQSSVRNGMVSCSLLFPRGPH